MDILQKAFQAHKLGRVEEAEKGYKIFLQKEPNHSGALNLYGVLLK